MKSCKEKGCGSYAINIDKAGLLCDVHFYRVQRDELLAALKLMVEIAELTNGWAAVPEGANGPLIQARAAIAKTKGGDEWA